MRGNHSVSDGTIMKKTYSEKNPEVLVDSSLTFKDHINHAVNKANQILELIRK